MDIDSPFMSYEFLHALEESGSVQCFMAGSRSILHLMMMKDLIGFMPLYIKNNSQGEFVFDHQWSYALNRTNRNYYPKLLSAIPFTPCETKKIITSHNKRSIHCIEITKELMEEKNIETWHILFPNQDAGKQLISNNFIKRSGYRFVWNNKKYHEFDDYLKYFYIQTKKKY